MVKVRYRRPDRLSAKGAEFIGRFEGFRAVPYADPAGHATVGFGHLLHHGPVTPAEKRRYPRGISRAEALALLRQDAEKASRAIRLNVKPKINQAQHDALVSFVFNVGTGAFLDSTLLKVLNRWPGTRLGIIGPRAKRQVREQLMRWTKAGGVELDGLKRRRTAEADLFSTGRYEAS